MCLVFCLLSSNFTRATLSEEPQEWPHNDDDDDELGRRDKLSSARDEFAADQRERRALASARLLRKWPCSNRPTSSPNISHRQRRLLLDPEQAIRQREDHQRPNQNDSHRLIKRIDCCDGLGERRDSLSSASPIGGRTFCLAADGRTKRKASSNSLWKRRQQKLAVCRLLASFCHCWLPFSLCEYVCRSRARTDIRWIDKRY